MRSADLDPTQEARSSWSSDGPRPDSPPRHSSPALASLAREWQVAESVVRRYADFARVVLQRRPNGTWQMSPRSHHRLRRLLAGGHGSRDG